MPRPRACWAVHSGRSPASPELGAQSLYSKPIELKNGSPNAKRNCWPVSPLLNRRFLRGRRRSPSRPPSSRGRGEAQTVLSEMRVQSRSQAWSPCSTATAAALALATTAADENANSLEGISVGSTWISTPKWPLVDRSENKHTTRKQQPIDFWTGSKTADQAGGERSIGSI